VTVPVNKHGILIADKVRQKANKDTSMPLGRCVTETI